MAAELDRDGRLHVRERHYMVFTGDWNGGERLFRLEKGQSLQLHRISRLGPAGTVDLRPASPPAVDEYVWAESRLLRWRSRAPTDPPFRATEIVYALEYTLSGVLGYRAAVYRLDHDFAFTDRAGPIGRFVLDLRLDPAWRSPIAFPERVTAGPLAPGTGYTVHLRLTHAGADAPAAVDHGARGWRLGLLALLAAAVVARLVAFWRGERAAGRLEALVPLDRIDATWLGQNVFHLPAEVVGAAWDRSVGAAEVAATLARLEAEGRIQTWTEDGTLHLRLLAPRTSLRHHERTLLDALLVGGGDTTDTDAVKRHYQSSGFDPAGVIRGPLDRRVHELLGPERRRGRWIPTALLATVAAAGLLIALLRDGEGAALLTAAAALVVYLLALPAARRWRRRVDGGLAAAAGILLPVALLVAGVVVVHGGEPRLTLAGLAAVTALALALVNSLLNQARATDSRAAIGLRKRLTSARRFLDRELRRGSPDVRVSWFPHLLALGLSEEADRWSARRPGSSGRADEPSEAASSGPAGGTSRSEPFSAGGGRFGGAGASGSWAAAAHAFSANIAAPSSSNGSGAGNGGASSDSGGGSSSSGGGGGGGW